MALRSFELEVGFPFRLDGSGRMVSPDYDQHIEELIEQVLFTSPGDRVNRPDFGAGILSLVFGSVSEAEASSTEFMVQASLQQWLGDLIVVEDVAVTGRDDELTIAIRYVVRRNNHRRTSVFQPRGEPWTQAP